MNRKEIDLLLSRMNHSLKTNPWKAFNKKY